MNIKSLLFFLLVYLLNTQVKSSNTDIFGDSILITLKGRETGEIIWQFSNDLKSWKNIPNSGTFTLNYRFTENGYFRCLLLNCDSTYYSDTTFIEGVPPIIDETFFKSDIYKGKKKAVFNKKDVNFCDVKVPVSYEQSQTHPSILYKENGWNGYDHWLVTTPYPNANYDFENPSIYYSNSLANGLPPTVFNSIESNPIQGKPQNGFNSDPDLILENDTLYCLFRQSISYGGIMTTYFDLKKSIDGHNWSKLQTIYTSKDIQNMPAASPAIIKENGIFRIFGSISTTWNTPRGEFQNFYIVESSKIDGEYKFIEKSGFKNKGNIELWHFDIFDYSGTLYMVLCGVDNDGIPGYMNTYLAVSYDRKNFNIFPKPLFSDFCTYRPTFYINKKNKFVLYLSTVDSDAKYFSIDGREIGLLSKDFSDLLNLLRENK